MSERIPTVAALIASWRRADGRTLREVAAEVGCAHSHLHDIEHERRFPSAELALKIAAEINCPQHVMVCAWLADCAAKAAAEMLEAQSWTR